MKVSIPAPPVVTLLLAVLIAEWIYMQAVCGTDELVSRASRLPAAHSAATFVVTSVAEYTCYSLSEASRADTYANPFFLGNCVDMYADQ